MLLWISLIRARFTLVDFQPPAPAAQEEWGAHESKPQCIVAFEDGQVEPHCGTAPNRPCLYG